MEVKNNYKECITNLACSIRKYFDLEYHHDTLKVVDDILESKKPSNVVVILFDGMGSRILDKVLPTGSFFRRNMVKEITTVFPATTTAATKSMLTGLNPCEHGFIGWTSYIEPIDKTVVLFKGTEKENKRPVGNYRDIVDKYYRIKSITEEINEEGKYRSRWLMPFGNDTYKDLDDMLNIIKEECNKDGKKYIYAYDEEPDYTLHRQTVDSERVHDLIKERNSKVEELCKDLKDTLVIVIADHGHIAVDNIYLNKYPNITKCFKRVPSLDQRSVIFSIKDGMKDEFEHEFKREFGEWFNLYSKEEVLDSKLFGDGDYAPLFESSLGDYLAIGISNKTFITPGDNEKKSHHAGYTDEEIYIPLIIIDKI